jgi:hypothetical protein
MRDWRAAVLHLICRDIVIAGMNPVYRRKRFSTRPGRNDLERFAFKRRYGRLGRSR